MAKGNTSAYMPKGKLHRFTHRTKNEHGMGFVEVPHALFRFRSELGLEPADLAVLLSIMSHTNGFDTATVAISQISNDTGYSGSTVKRSLKRLRTSCAETVTMDGRSVTGLGVLATVQEEGKRRWVAENKSATNTYSLAPLAERLTMLAKANNNLGEAQPEIPATNGSKDDGDLGDARADASRPAVEVADQTQSNTGAPSVVAPPAERKCQKPSPERPIPKSPEALQNEMPNLPTLVEGYMQSRAGNWRMAPRLDAYGIRRVYEVGVDLYEYCAKVAREMQAPTAMVLSMQIEEQLNAERKRSPPTPSSLEVASLSECRSTESVVPIAGPVSDPGSDLYDWNADVRDEDQSGNTSDDEALGCRFINLEFKKPRAF